MTKRRLKTPHIGRKTHEMPRFGPGLIAHRTVMSVAVEMANELFEVYARDNDVYRALRAGGQVSEKAARLVFMERMAPRLLEDARQVLTDMLTQPDDVVPKAQKDEIADALIKDTDLRANRFVDAAHATIPASVH